MKRSPARKLYYSIGEVSDLTELQPYTLRAWEKEFGCLRPRRIHGKNRAYRERDIGIVLLIKRLLYEERYSMRGVRQKLKNEPELLQGTPGDIEALYRVLGGDIPDLEVGAEPPPPPPLQKAVETGVDDSLRELVESTRAELREILRLLS